jgi:GAF domain-containing protein
VYGRRNETGRPPLVSLPNGPGILRHVADGAEPGRLRALQGLTAARRVAELLAPLRHPEQLVEILLHEGAAHLGANSASLCLLDADRTNFELVGAVGYGEDITTTWRRFPADAPVPARDAVQRGTPVLLGSIDERDERYPLFKGVPTTDRAYAVVPVGDDPAVGALTLGWPVERSFDDVDEVAMLELLGALAGQALERARLFAASSRAQSQLALLAEVSRRLGASLDVETTLGSVLGALVPAVADTAAVHLYADGELSVVAIRHRDPLGEAAMRSLIARDSRRPPDPTLMRAVVAGEVTLMSDVPPEVVTDQADDDEHRRLLDALDVRSGVVLPLASSDGAVGTIALTMTSASGRRFTDDDVEFLADVAGRAGTAIGHAVAHRARIEIAETLQQSLLPPSLPTLPGLEVASIYRPMPGGRVGGDFFDVFPLGTGGDRFGLLIGDVAGKGVHAAALTARIRYTVRALAPRLAGAADVVAHCNAAVHDTTLPERFATLVYAVVDTSRAPVVVDLVIAGHPEPVLWSRTGLERISPTGPVVGLFPDGEWHTTRVELEPGRTLILFTDGLTEARSPSGAFLPALIESSLSTGQSFAAAGVVAALVSALDAAGGGEARDDLAILALSPAER